MTLESVSRSIPYLLLTNSVETFSARMDYRSGLPDIQVFSGGSAWNVSAWPGWPLGRFLGAGSAPGGGWLGDRVSVRVWLSVTVSVYL